MDELKKEIKEYLHSIPSPITAISRLLIEKFLDDWEGPVQYVHIRSDILTAEVGDVVFSVKVEEGTVEKLYGFCTSPSGLIYFGFL